MLDRSFPTPGQYNSIRHFDVQFHHILPELLQGIGEILVKYQMHFEFGAFLLHRHSELCAGSVMVQTNPDPETEICRMELLENRYSHRSLSPCSFYMNAARRFKAFEYKEGPDMAVPGEEFLEEFGSFLHIHQLGDVIGVSTLPPGDEQWVETVLADGQGTIARRIPHGQASPGVVTEWAFFVQDGALGYKEMRKCDAPPEGGGHVRS
ncbi:hypothetical protein MMC28_005767 [Mycoblastus sanguinarius]|nr:hypothetical protein [Mycoblastus sanguinarius]